MTKQVLFKSFLAAILMFGGLALTSAPSAEAKKIDCRLVRCAAPTCKKGYKLVKKVKVGCCYKAICKRIKKPRFCTYKGKRIRHGKSFKIKCNTCHCRNGKIACTKKKCGINCALVRCAAPVCKPGYKMIKKVKKGCCYKAICVRLKK